MLQRQAAAEVGQIRLGLAALGAQIQVPVKRAQVFASVAVVARPTVLVAMAARALY